MSIATTFIGAAAGDPYSRSFAKRRLVYSVGNIDRIASTSMSSVSQLTQIETSEWKND